MSSFVFAQIAAVATAITLATLATAAAAAAQTVGSTDDRAPIIGVGVGYARSLHGDLDYGAPVFSLSFRSPGIAHFAFEPEIGWWRHASETKLGAPMPGGPQVTIRDSRAFWNAGFNALLIGGSGRIQGYGGGGVSTFWETSRYTQIVPDGLANPGTFESTRILGPRLGAQAVGGVNVAAARRIAAFAQVRYELRSFDDPGGAVTRIEGGLRIALR
jgi:hypothetical protein